MEDVVFVTGNPEKAENFAKHIGLPIRHAPAELDELQSLNVVEIVGHKARQAYEQIGAPVLVEDVTFIFHAFGELPGPFIKYFVIGENGDEKMCRMLDGFDDRSATASCTYAYYDGVQLHTFYGELQGAVSQSPRGTMGYGFDRVFEPHGFGGKTAAELSQAEYDTYYSTIKPFDKVREFLQAQVRG